MSLKKNHRFQASLRAAQQQDINHFGALHGTTGKTHTDPEFARQNGFGGVIVQGALIMAPVMDICHDILGDAWLHGGEIETKFVAYTRPDDSITVQFEVQQCAPDRLQLSYVCTLPDGKVVQTGTVTQSRT
ncbi:hypothetical protein GSY71_12095 [Pusillimonas sp. TS35]|nr:hypothetical protein [Pusillimonas sp. TS35]